MQREIKQDQRCNAKKAILKMAGNRYGKREQTIINRQENPEESLSPFPSGHFEFYDGA